MDYDLVVIGTGAAGEAAAYGGAERNGRSRGRQPNTGTATQDHDGLIGKVGQRCLSHGGSVNGKLSG